MRDEQRRFPYGPRDAGMYALWLATLGPTTLAFALATALRPALRARVPAAAWRVIAWRAQRIGAPLERRHGW